MPSCHASATDTIRKGVNMHKCPRGRWQGPALTSQPHPGNSYLNEWPKGLLHLREVETHRGRPLEEQLCRAGIVNKGSGLKSWLFLSLSFSLFGNVLL